MNSIHKYSPVMDLALYAPDFLTHTNRGLLLVLDHLRRWPVREPYPGPHGYLGRVGTLKYLLRLSRIGRSSAAVLMEVSRWKKVFPIH